MQLDTDELLDAQELAREEALAQRVEAFGASLAKKRSEAVAARKNSGIEEEWRAAEDAYQGVDDANRGSTGMAKPVSPDGGLVSAPQRAVAMTRSTLVLNITRPYVDAAAARVADMLLPTDDSPWSIRPTPQPTLARPVQMPAQPPQPPQPAPGMAPAGPGGPEGAPGLSPGMPGMPPGAAPQAPPPPDPQQQAAMQMQAEQGQAKASAERATEQISDWLVECQWHAEVRKLIEDCARLGTGILKGPTPHMAKLRAMRPDESGTMVLEVLETLAPESRCISPWNFYPDPACGEDVRDGSGVWERDTLSAKALRELKRTPGYLAEQIDAALEEGPQDKDSDAQGATGGSGASDRDVYTVWYYHGVAEREDLEAAEVDVPEEGDVTAYCVVTMVNNRVIKAALNPLDSGDFPYDVMPWQRKQGLPYGTGVAMQISVPQRMVTGAVRNLLDNAGLSSGPQIAMRRGAITPADGRWELTPRKFWWIKEDADVQAVDQAFKVFNIPTMQQELHNIVQFALKMAEDVTGMPALMQGQNTNAPDTVGGMQMLQNNAGTVLRRIARLFDDRVTEPHIRRYYEWLMLYGEDEGAKGDFQIDARGSTALVERDMQSQAIVQMGQLASNPNFGIDPQKWFTEMLKSQRLDPERFLMDEDEKAQMAQQPPPVAPQVEVAQIRTQGELQKAEMARQTALEKAQMDNQARMQTAQQTVQASVQKMQVDTDRDLVYVQAQQSRDQANHMAVMAQLELKRELAMLDYANKREMSLEQVKAELAKEAMKINATKELAGLKAPADLLPKPPVEPPGRAPSGESYQK